MALQNFEVKGILIMCLYREATSNDIDAIAHLHARSWQQHYRGILYDTYLDQEVEEDRQIIWQERLQHPQPTQHIIIATEGETVGGFACTYARHDPRWGALLDNLHVIPSWQGRGVGRALMQMSARWVKQQDTSEGLHLWVYEANTAARAFYERMGGMQQEKTVVDNPGGGRAPVFRYVWPDAGLLLSHQ